MDQDFLFIIMHHHSYGARTSINCIFDNQQDANKIITTEISCISQNSLYKYEKNKFFEMSTGYGVLLHRKEGKKNREPMGLISYVLET